MARASNLTMCSFCGKSHAEVLRLIAGPGVYICERCITVCIRLLDAELTRDAHRRFADIWRTLNRYVIGLYRTCLEWFQKHVFAKLPSLPSAPTEQEEDRMPPTASFTFRSDKKYQFEIDLDFAQRLLRNSTIGKSFYTIGFTDVSVVGSGSKRLIEVGWPRDDATVTVRMIPGRIDMSGPGFALAQILEGIGKAEEVQPTKEIP
jgi:ClpX C4-type zinc finger